MNKTLFRKQESIYICATSEHTIYACAVDICDVQFVNMKTLN